MHEPASVDGLLLDFEDACIASVRRERKDVYVVFEDLRVAPEGSQDWVRRRVEVVFEACTSESASYYVGAGVTAPHPNPALPLDFVQAYAFEKGRLFLEGQLAGESWFVWELADARMRVLSIATD